MADIFQIIENNGTPKSIGDSKSRVNTAEEFSTNKAYMEGDMVLYDGNLYEFTTDHSAGSWIDNQATTTNLADKITKVTTNLENEIIQTSTILENKITEAKVLIIEFSALSATTGTLITIPSSGTNNKIKSYTQPLPILNLSNPEYQIGDWTITIPDNGGSVSITGTASNTATSGKIYLVNAQ